MKFLNKLITKNVSTYDKYAYFKLAYGRGCNQLGIFREMLAAIPELLLLFGIAKFNLTQQLMSQVPGVILAIILFLFLITEKALTFMVGHIDIQNRLIERDISLSNKYNRELQTILKRK